MSEEKEQEKASSGFKVDDRRMFTSEGMPVDHAEGSGKAESTRGPAVGTERPAAARESKGSTVEDQESVDFASFVLSLATSAMAYLGEVPDPSTGQKVENLDGAKQMIDILSMLQAKTKGNLEEDEDRLISSLLYELRMKYLSKAQVIKL